MKADFTRNTFHPFKHFARVLMQQGRVQLDADWNEQTAILLRYLRTLVTDFSGLYGPSTHNPGFSITPVTGDLDFFIGGGHYYVAGILCEAGSTPVPVTMPSLNTPKEVQIPGWAIHNLEFQEGQYVEVFNAALPSTPTSIPAKISAVDTAQRMLTLDQDVSPLFNIANVVPRIRRIPTYLTQPDYPVPKSEQLQAGKSYQVYLDVWERLITYVEDDSIREVALGGPDTATRAKVVWQVRTVALDPSVPTDGTSTCLTVQQLYDRFQWANRGRLQAMATQNSTSTDPCIIPPDARYQGAENQLYRVEIHTGSRDDKGNSTTPTFKWSRENGSVIFPIVSPVKSGGGITTVTLDNLGRDDRLSLTKDDWVEIQDDDSVLQNHVGNLLQVQAIDRTSMTVTLNGTPDFNIGQEELSKHPLLRRWDQQEGEPNEGGLQLESGGTGSDGTAAIVEGEWLSLEDSIRIWFQKPDTEELPPNQYRTGDYWLIPARTATGDVEWPTKKGKDGNLIRLALPPGGVEHYYAPLAVITVNSQSGMSITPCSSNVGT